MPPIPPHSHASPHQPNPSFPGFGKRPPRGPPRKTRPARIPRRQPLGLPLRCLPLARQNPQDPSTVDVYELIINGVEISPGYSELNDPIVQRQRLAHQAGE
ncbi:MAG: hypothetical protein ACK5CW_04105, partial [Verrucomicrobiota bacterium]